MKPRAFLYLGAVLVSVAASSFSCDPQVHRIAGASSSTDAYNILFLGAGFDTDPELQTYRLVAQTLAEGILTGAELPYSTHADRLSFWRIDVRSSAIDTSKCGTGICDDDPTIPITSVLPPPLETLNATGDAVVDKDLGVSLCYSDTASPGPCRLLWADADGQKAAAELATLPPDIDAVVILANVRAWSGATAQDALSGSQALVVIGVPQDGKGVPDGLNLLAHELAHTLGLADEYSDGSGVVATSVASYRNVWKPPDCTYVPATGAKAADAELKATASGAVELTIPWTESLACKAMPITPALDCDANADTTDYGCPRVWWPCHDLLSCPNHCRGMNTECQNHLGLFEGAFYASEGIYRPTWDCKMRNLSTPFCEVCNDLIIQFFECNYIDPTKC